jgi:Leucine-rich repeat (LRR) protein
MSFLNESDLQAKRGYRNPNRSLDPIPEKRFTIGADVAGAGAASSSSIQLNRQWWEIMTSPRKEGSSLEGRSTGGLVEEDGVMNAEEGPEGPAPDSVAANRPFQSSWKFLTLIGLVVVCAGLGLYFIANNGKGKPPRNGGPKTVLGPSFAPSVQPETTTLSDADLQKLDNLFLELSGDAIYSSSSPQGQARLWLHSDDVTVQNAGRVRVTQRYSLCVLFFATSGPAGWPKTFLVKGAHECSWNGTGCDNGVVVRLGTASQNLVGALPEEIRHLSSLAKLSMHHNSLTGTLPEGLFRLTSLTYMDMKLNRLTGTLPPSMWSLKALTSLDVSGNLFNGTLSSNMTSLTLLHFLNVSDNQLTGTLPASMWSLSALTSLDVSGNLFNGTLSSSIWSLSNAVSLRLYNNSLTGPFPEIPGTMAVPPMEQLWVSRNRLTGALPESLNRLSATMREFLIHVLFYRALSWVSILSLNQLVFAQWFLGDMGFYGNNFVSTIPSTYSQLTQLTYLDLSVNSLFGEIPVLADSIALLFLDGNNLTGPLPALPESASVVWLNNNSLSGSVPSDFGVGLVNLSELHINGNKLTGRVPSELCNVASHNFSADCMEDATFLVSCSCCSCCGTCY